MKLLKMCLCLSALFSIFINFPTELNGFHIDTLQVNQNFKNNIKSKTKVAIETNEFVTEEIDEITNLNVNLNSLNFYKLTFNGNYYVADVNELQSKGILEIKLIENCALYNNFGIFSELLNEKYVLEVVSYNLEKDTLNKTFCKVPDNLAKNIIGYSSSVEKNSILYNQLLGSINTEYSFKREHQEDSTPELVTNSLSISQANVDNQAVLEHYLKCTTSTTDAGVINAEYAQNGFTYSSDDTIVNLIPKSYFRTNGIRSEGGSEWGYFINTYNDIGSNKIASLLIYDIDTYQADFISSELVEVKVVLHRNYKYYYDSDVVVGDVDNNYCIANPQFKASLRYFLPDNVDSAVKHLNPGNSGYDPLSDYGFSFGTVAAKIKGRYKNHYSGANPNNFTKVLVSFLADAAISGIVESLPIGLGTKFLVEEAMGFITDSIIDSAFKSTKDQNLLADMNDLTYEFNSISFSDYMNFDYMRRNKDLLKEIAVLVPNNAGNYDTLERECPLLMKNEADLISYRTNILSSEKNKDYYAIIAHSLKVEVFDDNSTIFHWNPDFLGSSSARWAYTIGIDSIPNDLVIKNNGNKYEINFGEQTKQEINFTPQETGLYSFCLENIGAFTKVEIYDENSKLMATHNSSNIKKTDKWNNKRDIANNKMMSFDASLTKNKTYKFIVYRNNENINLFGTGLISVFKESGTISSIYSSTVYKRRVNSLNGNDLYGLKFTPTLSGLYTFLASDSYDGSLDTYIEIRDSAKRVIFGSESGANYNRGIAMLTLKANNTYYIVARNRNTSHKNFKIYTYKENYLPYIRGQNVNVGYRMTFNGIKHYYYLINFSYSHSGTMALQFLSTNTNHKSINVTIEDWTESIVYNYSINQTNNYKYTLNANSFYVMHIYSTSSSTNEICVLDLA